MKFKRFSDDVIMKAQPAFTSVRLFIQENWCFDHISVDNYIESYVVKNGIEEQTSTSITMTFRLFVEERNAAIIRIYDEYHHLKESKDFKWWKQLITDKILSNIK